MASEEIESGVPMPLNAGVKKRCIGHLMEVGDSIFISPRIDSNARRAGSWNIICAPKRFSHRKDVKDGVEGYRIWRIA